MGTKRVVVSTEALDKFVKYADELRGIVAESSGNGSLAEDQISQQEFDQLVADLERRPA